jgi:hypothetical protein
MAASVCRAGSGGVRRLRGSGDRIVRRGRLAALSPHQPVEGGKIGPSVTLSKKFSCAHGCKLLRNSSRNELVDARAVLLCAALDLGLVTPGGMAIGNARLEWPEDETKELGMTLLLILAYPVNTDTHYR